MTELITIEDMIELIPISKNMNLVKQFSPQLKEAQEFDIKPILGSPLYLDLLANVENYDNLFLPYEYQYNNKTYNHNGIKSALIYYTWSRIISVGNEHSTPSGMMQKLNEFSSPVDEKTISRRVKQAVSGAIAYQNQFIEFLCRFPNDYPLYHINGKSDYRRTAIKIRSTGV